MIRALSKKFRVMLAGARLRAAAERNSRAADRLDSALREVLRK